MTKNLHETVVEPSTSFFMVTDPPFDFERSASIHSRFQKSLPDVYENGLYKRVLHINDRPVLVTISSKGTTTRPRLKVEVHPRLSSSEAQSLRKLLRNMFATPFDFDSFRRVAKTDRLMNTISRELVGLRPIAPPSIFEALVIAITEQQISLEAAIAIRSRLIEKYGDVVKFRGRMFYAFPTATCLAAAKPSHMRGVGLSQGKALYISQLARKIAANQLDLEQLREMEDDAAVAALTKIKGIGPWTAEYALVRGMGRVNSLPADDLGIQRAVSQAYFKGKRVSSKEVRRVLSRFSPYSGIAAFYLMYYLFWLPRRAE